MTRADFTAFIGFEWTSNTGGNNLHRNVIFRDNADKASQTEPYTTMKPLGSDNPRDLWKWMTAFEQKTGGNVLAIAHNGNLSNGIMFPMIESFTGKAVDREYVEQRDKWERLYETTQTKGDGEAHPFLSPNDEFADFETWDKGNLDLTVAKDKSMLEFEYTRAALKNGLLLEQKLGTNPYKFGLVGSSDAHTGLAAMEEENFFGKVVPAEPSPERLTKAFVNSKATGLTIMDWEVGASGYAAVWATENTRTALWDAMERKETYATTGSRLIVRFFGGWDFVTGDAHNRLPADIGYSKGVPMGGDLRKCTAWKVTDLPRRGTEGPDWREPRPHPGRQGLAGYQRQAAREGVRRGLGRRRQAQAGRRRQAAGGRQHGGRRQRVVDQHDRRSGTDHGVERPGLRLGAARFLLPARARDPDAALDRL